jgi:pyrroloquinoline quinone (PQQ) biosynthesis protein C
VYNVSTRAWEADNVKIEITPHPEWVEELLQFLEPYTRRITEHSYFESMADGTLGIEQFRWGLVYFYPLIESFPKYMALNLAKVPAGSSRWNERARHWLISNIHQERVHTSWWKQWAKGFGVGADVLGDEVHPPPSMDAINSYLWRVCTHGSLAEGMSATNFAVEGPTGQWTRSVKEGLAKYRDVSGIDINDKTVAWVVEHADYDDLHPHEALEIIKAYATTPDEQARVKRAAQRAMEYYRMALDACFRLEN